MSDMRSEINFFASCAPSSRANNSLNNLYLNDNTRQLWEVRVLVFSFKKGKKRTKKLRNKQYNFKIHYTLLKLPFSSYIAWQQDQNMYEQIYYNRPRTKLMEAVH